MATTPYIGSRISLISKSEIRYEGTLANIDTEASTVTLQSVTSFGTEGRRKDGPQIPPKPEVFTIIFRSADIKDLTLCNHTDKPESNFEDPAVVSITPNPETPPPAPAPASIPRISHQDAWPRQMTPTVAPAGFGVHGRGRGRGNCRGGRQDQKWHNGNESNRGRAPRRGNGRRRNHLRTAPVRIGTDFDFNSMNDRFDKEAELAKLSLGGENDQTDSLTNDGDYNVEQNLADVPIPRPAYNPSSFFDDLSSNLKDRQEGRGKYDGRQQRMLNQQTFGDTGWSHQRYHRGGRGRNRRGGRRGRGHHSSSRGGQNHGPSQR